MQPVNFELLRLEENRKLQSPFLDLGNCGLSALPKELADFTWLEDLNLGTVYWNEAEKSFHESINKGPLNHLAEENFSVLQNLPKLRRISLRNCSVRKLEMLSQLLNLQSLTLGGNEIYDITPLGKMLQLEVLSLFDNPLRDISALGSLSKLSVLSLNYNKIENISAISALKELRELHLAGNRITDLTPLAGLHKLEKLNLTNNKVRQIRPLTELPALQAVSVDRNPVEDCPPEIAFSGDMARIRGYFSTLSRSAPTESAAPDVAGQELVQVHHKIDVYKPPLEVKLILVGNATSGKTSLSKVLRNENFNQHENTTHGIQITEWLLGPNELSLILPGHTYDVPFDTLQVNIWDFGGQEYYHGTHQIFLGSNAVYLLLWDEEHNANQLLDTELFFEEESVVVKQEHFDFRYWLDSIRQNDGKAETEKPPVFIVQNKIDKHEGRTKLYEPAQLKQYGVDHTAAISVKFGKSRKAQDRRYRYLFELFREDLVRVLYNKARSNRELEQLPPAYVQIRQLLHELRPGHTTTTVNPFQNCLKDQAWIDFFDFAATCRTLNPELTDLEIETLAYYLHHIGAVVWLKDIDRKVYIDPTWLTSKIYRVLNERVRKKAGRFSSDDVKNDFGDAIETIMLLRLMQEWEIIFPVTTGKDDWVAPQYLPDEHPMENLFTIALTGLQQQFILVKTPLYHYRKTLRRLIFSYGNDSRVVNKEFWKNGILFVTGDTRLRVLIKGLRPENEPESGQIMICVEPGKTDTDKWRQNIFSNLLAIFLNYSAQFSAGTEGNATWLNIANNLRDEAEKHPELQVALDGENFVGFPALLNAANSGVTAIVTDEGKRLRLEDFSSVLAGLQITPQPPTIFFSYSHDDKPLRDELDKHLAPLRRMGKAKLWFDGAIGAGQDWEETIRKNLRNADVILLLISHNFINSEFIWNNELKAALERHRKGECRIIPVLLKPCIWEGLEFGQLQMLPQTLDTGRLKAVTSWVNTDEAYTQVARSIREALKDLEIE